MIFLAVGRDDRIGAGGDTIHLVLAHHRCRHILRNHKTGIKSGIRHKEFRQFPLAKDKLGSTPFGNISQFRQGDSQKIESHGKRLSVEAFTNQSNTDFSVQLQAVKNSGADLVFLPIYAQEGAYI